MTSPGWWDTVMFRGGFDELAMLEIRLAEFEKHDIAGHVIVEARMDHQGHPKPLWYAENKERFAAWAGRIVHVIAEIPDLPDSCPWCYRNGSAWAREHYQRACIWPAIEKAGATDSDVVNLSDLDEFPPCAAFTMMPEPSLAHQQKLCMYAVDWLYPHSPTPCSVTVRYGWAKGRDATAIRDARYGMPSITGGFHITWLGGLEGQREKLGVHCHAEMTATEHDRIWSGDCYERGYHHGDGGLMMIPVDVDETWPKMIYERKAPVSWFRPREESCA